MHTTQKRLRRMLRLTTALFPVVALAGAARAEFFQWEYIDPADPSQGKRQSTTLAPGGAGVSAVPGADLSYRILTKAYLVGADLMNGNGSVSNLTNADLIHANLTNASFFQATLTNADFTGSEIQGVGFGLCSFVLCRGTGISLTQLYSTASYQAHDLCGIGLGSHNLAGGQFGRQNLENADFGAANLMEANFREANLTNASFVGFRRSCRPLSGCNYVDLAPALITGVDFTSADTRGVILSASSLSGATTTNLIHPDGHINGLDLDTVGSLVVRDYDGDSRFEPAKPPIPITVKEHLAMGPGGTLRMVFEEDAWDSTISFAPGIPVTLGGTLELSFGDNVNLAVQVGRTYDLFDWTGVVPSGYFTIRSPYDWDLSRLYTTGDVTLTAVPEPTCAVMVTTLGAVILRRRSLYRVSFSDSRRNGRLRAQTDAIERIHR